MAEIRFTTERMKVVYDRLDEIESQLTGSSNSANEALASISSNIQSDNIKNTIAVYTSTVQEKIQTTSKNLNALKEYLAGKISSYTAADEAGKDSMSEIENLLSQLES